MPTSAFKKRHRYVPLRSPVSMRLLEVPYFAKNLQKNLHVSNLFCTFAQKNEIMITNTPEQLQQEVFEKYGVTVPLETVITYLDADPYLTSESLFDYAMKEMDTVATEHVIQTDKNKLTMSKGKTSFTKNEIKDIEALIGELETLPPDKRKNVRKKIRLIGLYWSELANGIPYTVENFHKLIDQGVISVENGAEASSITTNIGMMFSKINNLFKKTDTQCSGPVVKHNGHNERKDSDEYYVIGLCNEVLGLKASQQHKFDFLLGDTGSPLPVDAYYEDLQLVVEYYERQHTKSVKFFDKKMTVSGVPRGEQRRIYDERRRTELPKHGMKLVIIDYSDFGDGKKLNRNHDKDIVIVRQKLKEFI